MHSLRLIIFTLLITLPFCANSTCNIEDNFSVQWNKNSNNAVLAWSLPYNPDLSHIIIQRNSEIDQDYTNLGYVLPMEDLKSSEYTFSDESISSSRTYNYRLKYIFKSGTHEYSSVKKCVVKKVLAPTEDVHQYIFPNPADDMINMRLIVNQATKLKGGIFKNNGKKIKNIELDSIPKGLSEFKFSIESIEEGDYLMILKIGSENIVEKIKISR